MMTMSTYSYIFSRSCGSPWDASMSTNDFKDDNALPYLSDSKEGSKNYQWNEAQQALVPNWLLKISKKGKKK